MASDPPAAAVKLAHQLLDQAKHEGADDEVWQAIYACLRSEPLALRRPPERMFSLLHQAAWWGNLGAVERLLSEFGADPAELSRDGQTAAEVAAGQGNGHVVPSLGGGPPKTAEQVAHELLDKAKHGGSIEAVWQGIYKQLRATPGAVVRPKVRAFSLLHQAAYWGHVNAVETLVSEFGADPAEKSNGDKSQTAQEVAAERGFKVLADLLAAMCTSSTLARVVEIQQLEQDDQFESYHTAFHQAWRPESWHAACKVKAPSIKRIYLLDLFHRRQDYVTTKLALAAELGGNGNEMLQFHGTRLLCDFAGAPCERAKSGCNVCGILQEGKFLLTKKGSSHPPGVYGDGLYFTRMSHTAKGYGIDESKRPPKSMDFASENAGNAVFGVLVLAGNTESVQGQPYNPSDPDPKILAPPSAGFHSRTVSKSTGNEELVIFNEAQAIPRCLIVFG